MKQGWARNVVEVPRVLAIIVIEKRVQFYVVSIYAAICRNATPAFDEDFLHGATSR